METFKGAEVAPINEILGRTLYVKALREDIANLGGERDALAAQLEWRGAQFSVVIHERDDALTKLAEAEEKIERLRATISERKKFADDLLAERDDLAGKLAAAHQELHDLRIRAGLRQGIAPDWSQAPEWAQYWAMDADGWTYWYSHQPEVKGAMGYWSTGVRGTCARDRRLQLHWMDSLHQRPDRPATEKESS